MPSNALGSGDPIRVQAGVYAPGGQQISVVSLLNQSTLIEDEHPLGSLGRRQSVGDRYGGASAGQPFHGSSELND